jgi:hypothetical protein
MKSRAPTPAEMNQIRAVVDTIIDDPTNARLVAIFAVVEHFSLFPDFNLVQFRELASHEHGDVSKALRMAQIATGQADNAISSDAAVRALEAARAKVRAMFGEDGA